MARNRWIYAALMAITVIVGLSTRSVLRPVIGSFWTANLGDALWAVLIFLLLVFIRPRMTGEKAAVLTMLIAIAVECSQLLRTPELDALRRKTIVGLVIGYGFAWGDLVAYLCGVLAVWSRERWVGNVLSSSPKIDDGARR